MKLESRGTRKMSSCTPERGNAPALVPWYAAGPVFPELLVYRLVPVSMMLVTAAPVMSNASTTPSRVSVPELVPRYTLYRIGDAPSGMFAGAATVRVTVEVDPEVTWDTSAEA